MAKINSVVHFEMPAKDKKRVSEFYTKAFGWNMVQTGPEMGNYIVAQTAETDENNMVKTPGTINGGFFDYKDEVGFNSPHIIISVDDLKKAMEDVKSAGGEVLGEPMDIPTIGIYISFKDSEGNHVGMLQPSTYSR